MNRAGLRTGRKRQTLVMATVHLLIISLVTITFSLTSDYCLLTGCTNESIQSSSTSNDSMPANPAMPDEGCDNWCSEITVPHISPQRMFLSVAIDGCSITDQYISWPAFPLLHPPSA